MADETALGPCILEMMGHRRLAGFVSEQTVAGTTFLRIDVPQSDGGTVSQLYSPAAVYAITPVTEETMRRAATIGRVAPVERWELPGGAGLPPDEAADELSRAESGYHVEELDPF